MALQGIKLLICVSALATFSLAAPSTVVNEAPLHPFATECIETIRKLDFTKAHAIYDVIKEENLLDSSAFHIAAALKEVYFTEEYIQLSVYAQDQFESLKERLPLSVKNIVFASSVCILNLSRNEYLFSPNNDYIHDANSRNVFLWRLGGIVEGSDWTMNSTATPTDFKIINMYNEYLFADDSHYYLNRRNVYTYLRSEWTGSPTNVWRFKTVGDDVIMQNTWYAGGGDAKEYLYAAVGIYNYDNNRGRVFGWDKDWDSDAAYMWRVTSCT